MAALAGVAGVGSYLHWRGPTDPMARAQASLEHGDPAGARLLLLGVLKARPNNAEALLLLGRVSQNLGNPVAAESLLRKAGSLGVDAKRVSRPLADALLAQHKPREALDLLATDGAAPADLPAILVARANGFGQLDDFAAAQAALDEAGRLAPKLIDVPLASAALALRQPDLAQAERAADRAVLIDGRSADALLLKAQVLEQRGQRPAALDLLTKAAAADPKASRVRLERGRMLLSAGRTAEARAEVETLLAAEPANVAATYLKANVLAEQQDYAGADTLLLQIGRAVPALPRGWYTIARVKLHLEQLEQAAEAVEKYVARTPDDIEGRKLQARIALAAKRPGKALDALNQVNAAGTADAETLDLLGDAQAMAGRFAQAEASFSQASALAPKNPGIQAHLGLARLLRGDSPGAVEALQHSLQLAPEQAEVSEQLVVAAVTAGRPEQAGAFLAELRQRSGETSATGQLEALLAVAQNDLPGAASRLASVAAQHPDDGAVHLQLVRVLLMQGRSNDAEAVLSGVLAKDPAQEAALDLLVPLLERSGRAPRAGAVLEAARAAAPGNLDITLMLAALHARAGDPARALALLSGEAAQHDTSAALLLSRASMEVAAGQPDAARRTFAAMLKAAPGWPLVVERFAAFLDKQGAPDEAVQQLAAGLAASPGNAELQRALVRQRFRAAGLDPALAAADALRRDPINLPAAALLRGDVFLAAGKQANAADAYKAELAKAPSTLLATHAAAAENAARGPIPAVQLLRSWMAAHPDDLAAMAMLSSLLTDAKYPDAAAAVLEALLARQPNDTRLMNNLALAYHELGDSRAYPLALRAYLSTFSPTVADTLGCILVTDGRTPDALTLLRFAARELPDDFPVQLHLAQAARQAGLQDEARVLLTSLAKQQFDGRATATRMLAGMQTR